MIFLRTNLRMSLTTLVKKGCFKAAPTGILLSGSTSNKPSIKSARLSNSVSPLYSQPPMRTPLPPIPLILAAMFFDYFPLTFLSTEAIVTLCGDRLICAIDAISICTFSQFTGLCLDEAYNFLLESFNFSGIGPLR